MDGNCALVAQLSVPRRRRQTLGVFVIFVIPPPRLSHSAASREQKKSQNSPKSARGCDLLSVWAK